MEINIVNDFSDAPGGRLIKEGENSGEKFRKEILSPKYKEATEKGEDLIIYFDGSFGYSPSFLDESFGGLVRERKERGILNNIKIISNDDLSVERKIKQYVKDAEDSIDRE